MWDLIVSVSDHCLSFYFTLQRSCTKLRKKTIVLKEEETDTKSSVQKRM